MQNKMPSRAAHPLNVASGRPSGVCARKAAVRAAKLREGAVAYEIERARGPPNLKQWIGSRWLPLKQPALCDERGLGRAVKVDAAIEEKQRRRHAEEKGRATIREAGDA